MGFLKFSLIIAGLILVGLLSFVGVSTVINEVTKPNPTTLFECRAELQKEKMTLPEFSRKYPKCRELFVEAVNESNRYNELINTLQEIQYQIEDLEETPQEIMRRKLWEDLTPKYETPKLELKQFIK